MATKPDTIPIPEDDVVGVPTPTESVSSTRINVTFRFLEGEEFRYEFAQGVPFTLPRVGEKVWWKDMAEIVGEIIHEFEVVNGELEHAIEITTENYLEWEQSH